MPPAVSFAEGAVVHVVVVVLLERKRTRGSWRRKRGKKEQGEQREKVRIVTLVANSVIATTNGNNSKKKPLSVIYRCTSLFLFGCFVTLLPLVFRLIKWATSEPIISSLKLHQLKYNSNFSLSYFWFLICRPQPLSQLGNLFIFI